MKKIMIWLVALFLAFGMAGCSQKKAETSGYQIFYMNPTRTKLLAEYYTPQGTTDLEIVGDIFRRMETPVSGTEKYSLFPTGVEIQEYDLVDGQLTVTFNEEYLKMDEVGEILLRAGLVKSVTQMEGVRTVVFHIGDDVLRDSDGEPVGAMTSAMFINNPVGLNSYQYASLSLYFANKDGTKIVREMRNVHYSSNLTLEKVIMEQLIKGPMNSQLLPVLPEETKVLDVTVENKLCTLNLSREFLEAEKPANITPSVSIYCIVNSLCDMLEVDRVQFLIEGDSHIIYEGELSLNGPFHRNGDIIEAAESTVQQTENQEDAAQPSIGL
ncbi:MAG: GerMN domain-containing protein [Eubacteriales bacterium]|nr:GerMN domain-containing protein [Eubacteriales bacterium]